MTRAKFDEACSLGRIVVLAREVQAVSEELKSRFHESLLQPSALELARFTAAIEELMDARDAFDALFATSP